MRPVFCVQEGHKELRLIAVLNIEDILQMYVSLFTLQYNSYISIALLKKKEAHSNIHAPFKLS